MEVGEEVTIDASNSSDADLYRYDFDGDGRFDTDFISQPVQNTTYQSTGEYVPIVEVMNTSTNDSDVNECGTVTVESANDPPNPDFSWQPDPAVAGSPTTFNATASSDPDGSIVEYRWDFDNDGTVDNVTSDPLTNYTFTYSETNNGVALVTLTVEDDDGDTATVEDEVDVVQPEVTARCTVSPETTVVGEQVTIDASNSTNADLYRFDFNGDGRFDTDWRSDPVATTTYDTTGDYVPMVAVANTSTDQDDANECGTVTIQSGNEPPDAAFSWTPDPAVAGETTRLDASLSTDPDGTIVEYHWDFDGDGRVDRTTTTPETTYSFAYDETRPGLAVVTLTVVDDDNATATTQDEIQVVRPDVTARCRVSPDTVPVGEQIVIDASNSSNAETYEFDVDGDGTYDTDRIGEATITRTSDEPGEYTPRVRVYGPDGEKTDTARCGRVVVEGENEPPQAVGRYRPVGPTTGETVTLNASASFDTDGRIVEYRWDFDNDGDIDRDTTGPIVTRTFDSTGNHTVGLVVFDNDGATDRTYLIVPVKSDGLWPPPWWWWIPGGIGVGYLLCRGRGLFGGSEESGIMGIATGSFETPPGGGLVTVDGLGFEPDLVMLTATNNVTATDEPPDRTDGWTYGRAKCDSEGDIVQHAVGVAEDSKQADAGVAVASSGQAIDLLVHDDQGAYGLQGTVERTAADGFEMRFDTSALPDEHADDSFVVMFRAFDTAETADVDAGYFFTPGQAAVQTVDVGTDADYVELTAVEPLGEMDGTKIADSLLGVSHGMAVAESSVRQQVISAEVSSTPVGRNSHAAFNDRALHLLHGGGGEVDGRTSARVTSLGEQIELTYDEVYVPPGGTGGAGAGGADDAVAGDGGSPGGTGQGVGSGQGGSGQGAGGSQGGSGHGTGSGQSGSGQGTANGQDSTGQAQAPTAPPRLVTYVAVNTGDGPAPTVGHFRPSAPGEGPARIDTGFEPEVVEFTAGTADRVGAERTVAASPLSFGWSHGTAMIDPAGTVDHHVLHSSVSAEEVSASGPVETPATRAAAADEHGDAAASADGGTAAEPARPERQGGGAVSFVLADDGRIVGRDQVRVTAVDRTGFAVETERVGASGTDVGPVGPSVVLYTAWPREGEP